MHEGRVYQIKRWHVSALFYHHRSAFVIVHANRVVLKTIPEAGVVFNLFFDVDNAIVPHLNFGIKRSQFVALLVGGEYGVDNANVLFGHRQGQHGLKQVGKHGKMLPDTLLNTQSLTGEWGGLFMINIAEELIAFWDGRSPACQESAALLVLVSASSVYTARILMGCRMTVFHFSGEILRGSDR